MFSSFSIIRSFDCSDIFKIFLHNVRALVVIFVVVFVTACGGGSGPSDDTEVEILVTSVNENTSLEDETELDTTAPDITSDVIATSINENTGAGQVIYTVTSNDSSAVYALSTESSSNRDSDLFTIDSATGAVTLTENPNFEEQSKYVLIVTATDLEGNKSSSTITFVINNIALSSFDIDSIGASDSDIKKMVLTWSSAQESENESITYTVCEKDILQHNNCNPLTSVINKLTTTVTVNSLVGALSTDYFVLASSEDEFEASSEVSLNVDYVNKMIGYFKASNTGLGDNFGRSIVLSGDGNTLAVGTITEDSSTRGVITDSSEVTDIDTLDDGTADDSGAVYLFSNSSGKWEQSAYIKASNAGEGDSFGISIALNNNGTRLAVGALYEDNSAVGIIGDGSEITETDSLSDSGAVYLFNKNENDWTEDAYIKASNTGAGDNFGGKVALSANGDTLVVSAFKESNDLTGVITDVTEIGNDDNALYSGAVYLFNNNIDNWIQTAYIKASNTGNVDYFGSSVALNDTGTTLAVGAYNEDSGLSGVFTDGSEVTDTSIESNSGAVYLFSADNGVWAQTAFLKASNIGNGDNFAFSLGLSGDGFTLAVGAYKEDNSAIGVITNGSESSANGGGDIAEASSSGAVYIFVNNNDNWAQSAYVKASNTGDSDNFGYALALNNNGTTLAVTARGESNNTVGVITDGSEKNGDLGTALSSGAVYLFNSNNDGAWVQIAYIKSSNTGGNDGFGGSLSLSGNGSLAVGALSEDNSATGIITNGSESTTTGTGDLNGTTLSNSGAVYVY
jgi:hypothetical protein